MVSTRSRSKRKKKDEEGNIDDGAQDAADTISSAAKAASSSKALTPKKSPIKGIVTRLKTKKIRQQSPKEQREDDQDDDTRLDNETRVVPSDNDESMEAVLSTKTGNDNGDVESEEEGVTDVEDGEARYDFLVSVNVSRKLEVIDEIEADETGVEALLSARNVKAKDGVESKEAPVQKGDNGPSELHGELKCEVECSRCEKDVASGPFLKVQPCDHALCSECGLTLFAESVGRSKCPNCNGNIVSHVFCELQPTAGSTEALVESNPVVHMHRKTHPKLDPFRYWLSKKERKDGDGILHASLVKVQSAPTGENKTMSYHDTCSFNIQDGFDCDDDESNPCIIAAKYLYPLLFEKFRDNDSEVDTLKGLIEAAIQDRSKAIEFLYCLATGSPLTEDDREALRSGPSSRRSTYLAVYVAKEMLIRAGSSAPGALQKVLCELIYARSRDVSLIRILTDIQLTSAISTLTRHDEKLIDRLVKNRRPSAPRSFQVMSVDNVDFTQKGADAGKVSYTGVTMYENTESALKDEGFYESDPAKRICRKTRTFEGFVEDEASNGRDPAETVILPPRSEKRMVSFYVLTHIEVAIKMRVPGYKRLIVIAKGGGTGTREDFGVMPRNLGIDVSIPAERRDNRAPWVPTMPRKYERKESIGFRKIWDIKKSYVSRAAANNSYIDIPNRLDLSTKRTVQKLFNYQHDSFTKDVERDLESLEEGEERPVQEIMFPFCADGNPIANGHEILDQDANSGKPRLWPLLVLFLGGFHLLLEFLNMRGRLVEEFTRHLVALYRKSRGKQDWVIAPRDPNQAEEEIIPSQMAHYRAAADELAEFHGAESVSPAQVHRHMLDCAERSPIAMAFLIDTRLTTAYFILRDSEKARCVDRFLCAIRLALPLFALTNAFHYMRICIEFLVWWELSSRAMKVLFERFVFTVQTADGKGIFTDRAQEKDNRDVWRVPLGKSVHVNHDTKMVREALVYNETAGERFSTLAQVKGKKPTKPSVSFNESIVHPKHMKVFAATYVELREAKVYAVDGQVRVGRKKKRENAHPGLLQAPSGDHLCASLLDFRDCGTTLSLDYFNVFYMKSRYSVSRPKSVEKGGVPIRNIKTTSERQAKSIDTAVTLATSMDRKEIQVAAGNTKAPIVAEIRRVESELEEAGVELLANESPVGEDWKDLKVPQLADILIKLRSKLFEFKDPISEIKRIREEGVSSSFSTAEDRLSQMTSNFYQLDPTIVQEFETTMGFGTL